MAHAIEEGARGIAPGSGSAIVPLAETAATVVVAGEAHTRVATVTPRQPRQGQPRHQPAEAAPAPTLRRGRILALLAAVAVIAIVVVVVALSTQGGNSVQLQQGPFLHSFSGVYSQLTELVGNNSTS